MKKAALISGLILICLLGLLKSEQEKLHQGRELINVKVAGETETSVRMIIDITDEVKFHLFRVSNPSRLVVEMVDVSHSWSKKEIEIDGSLIKRIRSGQYKDKPVKIVRVVMDMAVEDYYYDEVSTKNQIIISVSMTEEDIKKVKAKEKKKIKKEVKIKSVRKPLSLEPNIPTEEHLEGISRILKEKSEREKKGRLERISKKELVPKPKKVSGTMFRSLSTEPVDFNFKEADILEILKAFALRFDKNIIPSASVSAKVSLQLKGVPFDEAFKMLLDRAELVAVQRSSNIIEVMRKSEMPIRRTTFYLHSRNAAEISKTLNGLLTKDEKADTTIAIDEASNSLIITATVEVLSKIELLVKQLDIRSPQIKIKVRLIEVNVAKDFNIGVSWANTMNLSGSDEVRAVKDMGNFGLTAGNITSDSTISNFGAGGVIDISAVIGKTTLYGILNFLATNSEAKVISEPTIVTENNKSAKIHVGRNLPVRTVETTASGGTIESVEFIDEGVDLEVTPVVSPGSNLISLKVSISVSEFIGFQADNPILTERSAETEVTIESGKTIVIGGLIRERITVTESGIPILKDIPLIGYLFKNKQDKKERSELLVFLTPEILID